MSCEITQAFVDGYVDGELDLVRSLEIEQHLQDCAICSQVYRNHQALRVALSAGSLYYKAPENLQKRIQSSVRKASQPIPVRRVVSWRWLGALASVALVAILTWGLTRLWSVPSAEDVLTQEVISSHVRSMMANHLADVASSDQHTVKPWFNGRLDFSPPVADLANQGFPLVGGRLDYLDNRPVAALVYQRRQHIINLFIWPSTQGSDAVAKTGARQGYYVFHWTKSGMTYWAVSDLNSSELQEFVQLVQGQPGGS